MILQKFLSSLIFLLFAAFTVTMLFSNIFIKNDSLAISIPPANYISNSNSDVKFQNDSFKNELRGIWFSYMDWNEITKTCVLNGKVNQKKFEKAITQVCENLKSINIDNLFLHVRAFGDAFYPSNLAPQSKYLNNINFDEFDPLKIFIEIAKKNKIKVHGWINPMRVFKDKQDIEVPDKFKIKQWFMDENKKNEHFAGTDNNNCWILNPCNEDVIMLISETVEELLKNYDLDGIHFDDYFFPSKIKENAFDLKYFENIKQNKNNENFEYFNKIKSDEKYYNKIKQAFNDNISIEKFRYLATSHLMEKIKLKCHEIKPNSVFGAAIIGNFKVNSNLFIDIDDWIKNSYVDYLMPEIYYSFKNNHMPFDRCVNEWNNFIEKYEQKFNENNIKLYIGMAAYRIGNEKDSDEGFHQTNDILKNQELYCRNHLKNYRGYCLFDYKSIFLEKSFKNELCKKNIVNLNELF